MSGYLEEYGAGEVKRARSLKRVALAVLVVLVAGGGFYYFFRNYRETRQAERFFALLRAKDYTGAYALWGCTPATPCPNYSGARFLEDWGPQGLYANVTAVEITKVRGCSTGVIIEANFGSGVLEYLWVDRKTREMGFAPQYVDGVMPVCNPVFRPNAGK
jgi:hypothetical protein